MGKQIDIFDENVSWSKKGSLYILKLTNEVEYPSSTIREFKDLIEESDDLYPGIGKWFDKKVMPGIDEGKRYAFLVMYKGKPIAEAVVKVGSDVKLCSMRIRDEFQNQAIGPILFNEIAKTLPKRSNLIHFTAPESLVVNRENLFTELGFSNIGKAKRKYRPANHEFVFYADKKIFINRSKNLIEYLRNYPETDVEDLPIVMSIHPNYLVRILNGQKNIELRRKFSKRLIGSTIFLYATSPWQKVLGEARIADIVEEKPNSVWSKYHPQLGCSIEEFKSYSLGLNKIFAIFLDNVVSYKQPITWGVFSTAFGAPVKPPQSYSFLTPYGFNSKLHNYATYSPDKINRKQLSLFEF